LANWVSVKSQRHLGSPQQWLVILRPPRVPLSVPCSRPSSFPYPLQHDAHRCGPLMWAGHDPVGRRRSRPRCRCTPCPKQRPCPCPCPCPCRVRGRPRHPCLHGTPRRVGHSARQYVSPPPACDLSSAVAGVRGAWVCVGLCVGCVPCSLLCSSARWPAPSPLTHLPPRAGIITGRPTHA
jgi:hypothetical protein